MNIRYSRYFQIVVDEVLIPNSAASKLKIVDDDRKDNEDVLL